MVFASKELFKYVHDHNIPIEKWPYRDALNVYFLYPNCIFLVDPAGVDMFEMYPDPKDPAKSKTYHTYYLWPALLDHLRKEGKTALEESRFLGFNKVVVDEDYAAAATSRRALRPEHRTTISSAGTNPRCSIITIRTEALGLAPLEPLMN